MFSGLVGGEPFSLPAGPVSIAVSAEHRRYADFAISYDVKFGDLADVTAFFNVRNLFDTPPGGPRVSGNALQSGGNALLYDVEGRTFRTGLRFRL